MPYRNKLRRRVALEALENRRLLVAGSGTDFMDPVELEELVGRGHVELQVINQRTDAPPDVVFVGDILQVNLSFSNDGETGRLPEFFQSAVKPQIGITFDGNRLSLVGDRLFRVNEVGTATLATTAMTTPPNDLEVVDPLTWIFYAEPSLIEQRRSSPGFASFLESAVNLAELDLEIIDSLEPPDANDDQYDLALPLVPEDLRNTKNKYVDLPMTVDVLDGVLANDVDHTDSVLRAVLIEETKHGRLDLREDGSFEYLPRNELSERDSFSYVAVSEHGTSEVRTVTIVGAHPPVLDLRVQAVNARGEPMSSVTIGQEFDLQVTVISTREYGRELSASFNFNPTAVAPVPDIQFNYEFSEERLTTTTNGVGELSLETLLSPPTAIVTSNGIEFDAPGFRASKVLDVEKELFRAKFVAMAAGEGEFDVTDIGWIGVSTDPTGASTANSHLINIVSMPLTVHAGSVWQNPNQPADTNADGFVSPLDALLGINRLNETGPGALPAQWAESGLFFDANGDGSHTAVDVLTVINFLNAMYSQDVVERDADFMSNDPVGEAFSPTFPTTTCEHELPVSISEAGVASTVQPATKIRLQASDLSGNPLAHLDAGEEFYLQAYVQDSRNGIPQGFSMAAIDVAFDASRVSVAGGIEYGDRFPDGRSGVVLPSGLFNQVGGSLFNVNWTDKDNPNAEDLLFQILMRADSAGSIEFQSGPAHGTVMSNIMLRGRGLPISNLHVDYGRLTLTVGETHEAGGGAADDDGPPVRHADQSVWIPAT